MKDTSQTSLRVINANGSGGHSATGLIPLEALAERPRKKLDIGAIREKLASGRGPAFWRTLEEAAESEDLKEYIEQEFPGLSGQIPQGVDRRSLLKVMAASLAMAGAAACTKLPKELIVPYVKQPENVIPGIPLFYATAMPTAGYARGLLVESHLNRPTKVEGNPDHPASLGATTFFEQASPLNLYDPDRSESVLHEGRLTIWSDFTGAFSTEAQELATRKGEGLAILSGKTTSPTLISQMNALRAQWPAVKWYIHEPSVSPAIASAAKKIAGRNALIGYDLSRADVIVSLESDFLNTGPAALAYARQFAARRSPDAPQGPVRLYAIEATPSVSGSLADHHLAVKSSAIPAIAYQLAKACGVNAPDPGTAAPSWLTVVAQDLTNAKGRCVVIPGEFQPEAVHLAAYAINEALGNIGTTVKIYEGVEPENTFSTEDLVNDLNGGHIETLVIFSQNPVYSAPASLNFQPAMRKARLVVRVGQMFDETSRWSHWHIPEAHYLETWSDSRAFDGTVTIQQPLIQPLYDGKSAHEVLSILLGKPDLNAHEIVKGYWQTQIKNNFDVVWQTSLHDGWIAGSAVGRINGKAVPLPPLQVQPISGTEIVFRPDPTIGDGSWANNGWLQECPKPQSKMTWDNIVAVSPKNAQQLGVDKGDMLRVSVNGRQVVGPTWVLPGHAEDSFTVYFGYGRTASGRVGTRIGYDAYSIQDAATPFVASGSIEKTGEHYRIANIQETQTMAGREPVRAASLAEYRKDPSFPTAEEKPRPREDTLYPDMWHYNGYKWGMVIDLNVCTGCSACIIACQAENNIAVVGKDQVARGRHMHWIRVDRYYSGNLDEPAIYNQPVPCMHCENAPCELVCPVAATVHSNEGLNEMVYNRCVGTRYCSNNCPYKVRRFNFYLYSDWNSQSLYGLRNPDVTVRSRGVMEKCSYCVQRIQETKIKTEKEGRSIRDGEILTACQQVCPTQAITFGDLNNKGSRVAALRAKERNYAVLDADLDTRPRTTYLGYVRNPNEALRGQSGNNRES
ncbi:MAG: TAT-variant-translocated molybdopterin oxidoreductase [Acidobacteriaceae bacterium]|nr:TAT-variant-translocated molybdopterin oxidoreductase [Acidobacteriaceae bacterium]